jgi:RimJ/RimL family protein N-acetyltransferase
VRLRRTTVDDRDLLELWQSGEYTGEFNDFGLGRRPVRKAIEENALVSDQGGTLIVELIANGKPIGTASWHTVRYGPNSESAAWNIGINLIPEARGHGYGGETQRLLADHLIATTSINRIEAATDVDNTAEQRALEKAGFSREGVLRGAQYRAGAWHDLVIYALVRKSDLQ